MAFKMQFMSWFTSHSTLHCSHFSHSRVVVQHENAALDQRRPEPFPIIIWIPSRTGNVPSYRSKSHYYIWPVPFSQNPTGIVLQVQRVLDQLLSHRDWDTTVIRVAHGFLLCGAKVMTVRIIEIPSWVASAVFDQFWSRSPNEKRQINFRNLAKYLTKPTVKIPQRPADCILSVITIICGSPLVCYIVKVSTLPHKMLFLI